MHESLTATAIIISGLQQNESNNVFNVLVGSVTICVHLNVQKLKMSYIG